MERSVPEPKPQSPSPRARALRPKSSAPLKYPTCAAPLPGHLNTYRLRPSRTRQLCLGEMPETSPSRQRSERQVAASLRQRQGQRQEVPRQGPVAQSLHAAILGLLHVPHGRFWAVLSIPRVLHCTSIGTIGTCGRRVPS